MSTSSSGESSGMQNDRFFRGGLPDEFTPRTGDPSLSGMPWIGRPGDSDYQQEPSSSTKVEDQKHYVKMTPGSPRTRTDRTSSQACRSCGAPVICKCPECSRKGSAGRKGSSGKRARRIESMAAAAIEAEKLGRRLATAVSMFAAGLAYGSITAKWGKSWTEEDEESETE